MNELQKQTRINAIVEIKFLHSDLVIFKVFSMFRFEYYKFFDSTPKLNFSSKNVTCFVFKSSCCNHTENSEFP